MLDGVVDPGLKPAPLLVLANIEKILSQNNVVIDDHLPLDYRNHFQEFFILIVVAESHHSLDPRPIIPRAVEENDLACRRELRHVTLEIYLRLLAVRGCGQCHVPVDAWACAGSNPADYATLARCVPA